MGIFMHIQAYSDIFKHKQKYSQAHSEHSVTLAYLEPWHIQYQKHIQSCAIYIQSPDIFRTLLYSELWHIHNPVKRLRWRVFTKIVNGYNYFHIISSSSSLLYEKNKIFLIICIPEVFIQCKVWGPGKPGAGGSEFLKHLFADVFK